MATVVSKLKPRSTILNENEQQERLKPNGRGTSIPTSGTLNTISLGPNETTVEDGGISRVRKRSLPNTLPAVSNDNGLGGETIGNKTFQLRGGATPHTPQTYALLFIDPDASITAGDVDVSYDDDTDTPRVDNFDIIADGIGPHETSFPVKQVTDVTGQNFTGKNAGDALILGPACPDTVDWIVGSSGKTAFNPANDPNDGGNDGDALYVAAASTGDQDVAVGFKDLPAHIFEGGIITITGRCWVKNVGATTNGIEVGWRIGGVFYPQNSTTVTGLETGPYQILAFTDSINPDTSAAWTKTDVNNVEIMVRFKGDSPTVEKRWAFVRLGVSCRGGFVHNVLDGGDLANIDEIFQAVDDDPFGTPDDTEYVPANVAQSSQVMFDFEDLPTEAYQVISCEEFLRWTQLNNGGDNTSGENDFPCGIYQEPKYGDESYNRLEGPLDQQNLGGMQMVMSLGSAIIDPDGGVAMNGRYTANRGDPSGGCGNFSNFDDLGTGYGDWRDLTFLRTLNSSSAEITVAQVNAMQAGWRNAGGNRHQQKVSRVYVLCEFRRSAVGGEFFPHLAIDDDPNGSPAVVDADYVPSKHSSNKKFIFDFAGIPDASEVIRVTVRVRARTDFGASQGWRIFWRTSGGDTNEAEQTNPTFQTLEFNRTLHPDTGAKWTREEVNTLQIGWEAIGENAYHEKDLAALELEVEYVEIPEKVDAAKDVASRRLRRYRRPRKIMVVEAPIQFGDPGLLGTVALSHSAHPALRNIAGLERWERRLMRVLKQEFDLNEMKVRLTLEDLREQLLTFWATLRSRSRGLSFDGMAVMTPGGRLKFVRKTNAYYPDPNDGAINELTADEPKTNEDGTAVEDGSRNDVINSGFAVGSGNNFTDWAKNNDGVNGGSVTEETGVSIWRRELNDRSVLLTSGSPVTDLGVEALVENQAVGASLSPSGARYVLSIDHQDLDGQPLSVQIERQAFTTQTYVVETQTFTSGSHWFDLPVRSSPTRDRVPGSFARIDIGVGGVDPVDLVIRLAARSSAGQRNRVFHVQWEGGTLASGNEKSWPTSRILTKTGPVVRDADQLYAQSFAGRLTWPTVRGTWYGLFVPFWDSVDLPSRTGVKLYVIGNFFNADNHDAIYYDVDAETFIFERKLAGVTTQATFFRPGISAGVPIELAARWTSEELELGLTANTQDLFVDRVKGTPVAAAGGPAPGSSQNMYLGSFDGSDLAMAGGILREYYVTQQVLTDSEIRRLP